MNGEKVRTALSGSVSLKEKGHANMGIIEILEEILISSCVCVFVCVYMGDIYCQVHEHLNSVILI